MIAKVAFCVLGPMRHRLLREHSADTPSLAGQGGYSLHRHSLLIAQAAMASGLFATGLALAQRDPDQRRRRELPPRGLRAVEPSRRARPIGVELSTRLSGSVAGVERMTDRTVDFGASDAPRSANRLREGSLLQFPSVLRGGRAGREPARRAGRPVPADARRAGGHLPRQDRQRWNDAKLAEHNRDLRLPDFPSCRSTGARAPARPSSSPPTCRACPTPGRTGRAPARP